MNQLMAYDWHIALLCVCQVLRGNIATLAMPARHLSHCCKHLAGHFRMKPGVQDETALWEVMAQEGGGQGEGQLPAFVQLWDPTEPSLKEWLLVGLAAVA